MKNLSAEAKILLASLYERPEWKEILEELRYKRKVRYKPIKQADHQAEAQFYDWVFYSGRFEENDRLINFLSGVRNDAS